MLLPDLGDFGWHQARHFSPQFARRITTLVQVWTSVSLSCPRQGLYGGVVVVVVAGINMLQSCTQQGLYGVVVVVTGLDMSQSCTQQGL